MLEGLPEMDLWLSWLLVLVLTPGIFLQLIQFLSLYKNQHSKFQFYLVAVDKKSHPMECPLLNLILFITIQWIQSRYTSTLKLSDQICNSPYCQPYNSYNVSLENLVLDQKIIPKLIFFFILITYLVDIVLVL